jgi:hypothetical protein
MVISANSRRHDRERTEAVELATGQAELVPTNIGGAGEASVDDATLDGVGVVWRQVWQRLRDRNNG